MEEQPVSCAQSIPFMEIVPVPVQLCHNFPSIDRGSPKYRRRKHQDDSIETKGIYYFGKGNISIRIRILETGRKKVVGGRNERDPLFSPVGGGCSSSSSSFPRQSEPKIEAVTCGNRDNYNVSARFRRDAGRMPVITKPPPPHWNRPAGGESTLMLAPVTGNHPRPVFQSVSFAI